MKLNRKLIRDLGKALSEGKLHVDRAGALRPGPKPKFRKRKRGN